jgi:hypothetical protein
LTKRKNGAQAELSYKGHDLESNGRIGDGPAVFVPAEQALYRALKLPPSGAFEPPTRPFPQRTCNPKRLKVMRILASDVDSTAVSTIIVTLLNY